MATLREHERGTVAIEVAYRHKLILIPTSTSIDVRTLEQGLDKEQTELVVQTLRRRKKDILRITSSPIPPVRRSLRPKEPCLMLGMRVTITWTCGTA